MTREEAYNRIDAIIAKYEIDDEYVTITNSKDYDALRIARKALEQPPCEDAISRQAVLDYIDHMPSELTADGRRMIRRRILEEYISDTLPPVTPQPKTGHWIVHEIESTLKWLECSNCRCETSYNVMHNYCPNCGAKMIEPQERSE